MGLIVDTGVFIAADRTGIALADLIRKLPPHTSETLAISAITVAELVQGIYQSEPSRRAQREKFVRYILDTVVVLPFSESTGWLAGRLRGEAAAIGASLPSADSLIAATALEVDYSIVTLNVKDFTRVPGLNVIPFTL
jgi:tRNA(fMet)-specific endonuclease VapC